MMPAVRVGVAGWSLRRDAQHRFSGLGSHLQRYAGRLNAVEINSSFSRPHRETTYARWAESVPADFRFSVKVPRTLTHDQRLREPERLLDEFLPGPLAMGPRLGCLLIQLPPSLTYEPEVAAGFLDALRGRYAGPVVLEPRHPTWFTANAEALLVSMRIGRVAADPPRDAEDGRPAGWPEVAYYRLHGAPRIYYSDYSSEFLSGLAPMLVEQARAGAEVWCIFDNTALGFATLNALSLRALTQV
jgi:uncharacterized protein YecE (DUF72 family)